VEIFTQMNINETNISTNFEDLDYLYEIDLQNGHQNLKIVPTEFIIDSLKNVFCIPQLMETVNVCKKNLTCT